MDIELTFLVYNWQLGLLGLLEDRSGLLQRDPLSCGVQVLERRHDLVKLLALHAALEKVDVCGRDQAEETLTHLALLRDGNASVTQLLLLALDDVLEREPHEPLAGHLARTKELTPTR